MSFDIGGPAGDLAIFTNNDDMFNINTDIGPNLILDQGNDIPIANIATTNNLTSDIILDMPDEQPVDFIKSSSNNLSNKIPRSKIESNSSSSTIEAEPIKKKKSNSHSQQVPEIFKQPYMQKVNEIKSNDQKPPTPKSNFIPFQSEKNTNNLSNNLPNNLPDININTGFDDILDNKKLKPVNDILDDAASQASQASQATIKYGGIDEFPSAPNSPAYNSFKPINQAIPDSPLPTTIKEDRNKRNNEIRNNETRNIYKQEQTYAEQSPVYEETSKYINEDDEKMDLLLKLKSLEERGKITLSKHYNIKSSIEEIRMEYKNQTGILEMQASVNFMRKGLIFCTSGLEYMNRRFDPIGAKLDGWGESIMENMMDYDGIFERLHHKYKGSMQMEPEMELLFALAGSAFQFHLSQTFFKSAIPQLGQVLRENPSVIQGFVNVAQEAARRNNTTPLKPNNSPMPANGVGADMPSPGIDFSALLGQVGITSGVLSDFAKTMGNPPPPPQSTRDYREPPVNDLYRQMMQNQQNQDNSDALSVSSETSDKSISKGKKAIITPIPTSKRGGGGNVIKLL